jgi:hypothetical protein
MQQHSPGRDRHGNEYLLARSTQRIDDGGSLSPTRSSPTSNTPSSQSDGQSTVRPSHAAEASTISGNQYSISQQLLDEAQINQLIADIKAQHSDEYNYFNIIHEDIDYRVDFSQDQWTIQLFDKNYEQMTVKIGDPTPSNKWNEFRSAIIRDMKQDA